jgi:metal-dependent amidase/aminoacylase/carboxypeptidase family protein
VIPERASAQFYIRARQQEQLEMARERVKACAEGAASMIGARVEWRNFEFSYQSMISNPTLAGLFRENLRVLGVRDLSGPREAMGSIDMGNVSQVVPGLHPYLALNGKYVPHSREFARVAGSEIGESVMMTAVKAMACTAIDFYLQPELAAKARAELQRRLGRGV